MTTHSSVPGSPEFVPGTMISRPAQDPGAEGQSVYTPPQVAFPEVVPIRSATPPQISADMTFGDHKTSARKPLSVDLVGFRYMITPPKLRSAVRMFQQLQTAAAGTEENPDAAFEQYDAWITKLFRERAPEVIARLDDEDDELDLVHINQLTQALMERAAGADPTGSPSA